MEILPGPHDNKSELKKSRKLNYWTSRTPELHKLAAHHLHNAVVEVRRGNVSAAWSDVAEADRILSTTKNKVRSALQEARLVIRDFILHQETPECLSDRAENWLRDHAAI